MIPKLSELTFDQFDKVMMDGEVTDLKEYISVFIDMDMSTLMNSEFSGTSLPSLHQSIFDVDINNEIKDKKQAVKLVDKYYLVRELSHNTFGKNYHFALYNGLYKREKISFYTLCVYALAISLSHSLDNKEIEKNYQHLSNQKWLNVLPQGFFLARKLSGNKINSMRLWVICTLISKGISLKMKISKKKLITLETI